MLIDSHCHLHDREFFTAEEAEECLKRARGAGVEKIVCIGTSHEDSLAAYEFASSHDNVYWTYGIHPENSHSSKEPKNTHLKQQPTSHSAKPTVIDGRFLNSFGCLPVAIGEVGLDYHYEGYDRDGQIRLFEEMLQLAVDNNLPVSFHVREAFDDFFPVVANFPKVGGVLHSFTDSKKVLKRILTETGFYVGVNGLATYSTLPMPPLSRVLLETDAPFLAPIPYRGEKNEPAYIADIAKWLAKRLETSEEQVANITTENVRKLFRI